jgi:hypothetical protein
VGYQSLGHGFFLEDGTEVENVLDRNLAVQAYLAKPLPKQVLPYDKNDGSGFWWPTCHNTFVNNVACDCDEYGYFFQAPKTSEFDPVLSIRQSDGTSPQDRHPYAAVHPFRRQRDPLPAAAMGSTSGEASPSASRMSAGIGPDNQHPFVIRNLRAWNVHWAIHPVSPSVFSRQLRRLQRRLRHLAAVYKQHVYRQVRMDQVPVKTQYAFDSGRPPW